MILGQPEEQTLYSASGGCGDRDVYFQCGAAGPALQPGGSRRSLRNRRNLGIPAVFTSDRRQAGFVPLTDAAPNRDADHACDLLFRCSGSVRELAVRLPATGTTRHTRNSSSSSGSATKKWSCFLTTGPMNRSPSIWARRGTLVLAQNGRAGRGASGGRFAITLAETYTGELVRQCAAAHAARFLPHHGLQATRFSARHSFNSGDVR
jgi:hypothetical protein